ncbi:MAG TPA: 23S rRNA (guanosine(2251)-2'-O)-methyltransferase RlmB [Syntrophobacteraceae bacterium]|nr:23S rRNA (guanosine(2251)-2'-O)-methyltransferase RlmB [Syntrophobacteraceae bacterium]
MKKIHPPEHEIWISGVNPVREALRAGWAAAGELVLSRSNSKGREIEDLAMKRGIAATRSVRQRITELAGHTHHQGVALSISQFPYADLESLLEKPLPEREPVVVLDSIQDPQNLGAILRSACFLGAKGVIIPKDRSASVSRAVIKIASGATAYIPVARVTNVARSLQQLKSAAYWVVGLEMTGKKRSFEVNLNVPLCLVIGNEQKGIRPLVRSECDLLIQIPAGGPLESLNAASAATVALYEVLRQRLVSGWEA